MDPRGELPHILFTHGVGFVDSKGMKELEKVMFVVVMWSVCVALEVYVTIQKNYFQTNKVCTGWKQEKSVLVKFWKQEKFVKNNFVQANLSLFSRKLFLAKKQTFLAKFAHSKNKLFLFEKQTFLEKTNFSCQKQTFLKTHIFMLCSSRLRNFP